MKQQFLLDTPDTFRTHVYENNRRIVPSQATLTVYRPGSTAKLIDAQAVTVGADGLLSYELTSQHNSTAGLNYKAAISYTYGGRTYYATLFYDVVKSKLVKVITDEDVVAEFPQLKDMGWRIHGTADSGSQTTIVSGELKRFEEDYFAGGLAYLPEKDETREITDFTSSTGTVTTTPFSSAVTGGSKYILTRSYSKEIQRAFEKIEDRIIRLGKRPELILDPYDLREVHVYFSVAEVTKGLIAGRDSFWQGIWKEYERKAEEALAGLNFKYDTSGDGYIAGSESSSRIDIIRAGRN